LTVDISALEHFIAEAKASGGSEISNTQPFLDRLRGRGNLPEASW
jgi:hypothetical protein